MAVIVSGWTVILSAQTSAFAGASVNASHAPAVAAVFPASGGLSAAVNAATLAQSGPGSSAPVQATVPSISGVDPPGAHWRWVAMAGFAALVGLPCFKNPKRAHNH